MSILFPNGASIVANIGVTSSAIFSAFLWRMAMGIVLMGEQ
ncbi:hypothetical protein [Vibrio sp. 10N.261.46.A3]